MRAKERKSPRRLKNLLLARPGIYTRGRRHLASYVPRPTRRYGCDMRGVRSDKYAARTRLGPAEDKVKHEKR